jgi:hypothetical protein
MEAIVASPLTTRWQRVHGDMTGDIAWIAIYRSDHRDFGECRPNLLQGLTANQKNTLAAKTYRQLVLHLEIAGLAMLLDAQEGRSVRQAGIAIQSELTEHIRSTDRQRSLRRAGEYHWRDPRREHATAQLSDPNEYVTEDVDRGSPGLDERKMAYRHRVQTYQRIRPVLLGDVWLIDHDHKEDEKEDGVEEEAPGAACLIGRAGSLPTAVDEPHQPDNQDSGSGSGGGHIDATLGEALAEGRWRRRQHESGGGAKANGAGRGRMKTNEKGEPFEDPGKTVASMMASLNRVIRHLRDQKREYLSLLDQRPPRRGASLQGELPAHLV